jgi:hypothetical protein
MICAMRLILRIRAARMPGMRGTNAADHRRNRASLAGSPGALQRMRELMATVSRLSCGAVVDVGQLSKTTRFPMGTVSNAQSMGR